MTTEEPGDIRAARPGGGGHRSTARTNVPLAGQPKHRDIYEALGRQLDRLPAGAPLPPERELCELYRASRPTIRRALERLEADRRIVRQRGRGTFVARPKIDLALELTSLSEDMLAHGVNPGSKLIDVSRLEADAEIARRLGIETGSEVLRVERLRLGDGEPVALEVLFVSTNRFDGISAALGLGKSFYQLLHTDYGVELASAEETIEAVAASPREARLLGVEVGTPVLLLSRRTVDTAGQPTEYVHSIYRADRFRLRSFLVRPATSRASLDGVPNLRLGTVGDVPQMARVFVDAWRGAYQGIVDQEILGALDETEIATWLRALMGSPNQATVVAVSPDGSVVGFSRFGEDPEDPRRGQIYSVYVAPSQARRGIGRALVRHALADLGEHGRRVVTLWVFEANAAALSFYASLGFTPDGARRVEPQYRAQEVRLVRDVAAPPAGGGGRS